MRAADRPIRSRLIGPVRRPALKRTLSLSIASLITALNAMVILPAAQAQVVVADETLDFTGTGTIDLSLTVGPNGIANFQGANWLIGSVPGIPRLDVLGTGVVNQTDSIIRFSPAAQIAVQAGGVFTITGASAILAADGSVSDARLTNDGTFDFSQITTALPLSARIDLVDPVNVPINAGVALGSLAGTGTINMTDRVLVIGTDNTESAFAGSVALGSSGRFLKAGMGTLTIDGSQFQGGETFVGQGTFAQTAGNTGISYLSLGIGAGSEGTLEVSGGTLTIGTSLHVGDFGGAGTVNQTGGSVVLTPLCGNPANCVSFNIGNQGGSGIYRLSGGTLDFSEGFLVLGRNTNPNAASTGILEISGSGHATLGPGATLVLGNNNPATTPGTGTINQTGGTLTVDNTSFLNLSGSGAGTYNLNGGTLQIGGTSLVNNYLALGGPYALNLGGGTVQAFGSALVAEADAMLTGSSSFDSNGLGIRWNGVLSGAGTLNKTGAGALTLTASNLYSGGTQVVAGTLNVLRNDVLGSGTVTILDQGTVDVAPEVTGDFSFNNALAGTGLFNVSLLDPADAFSLGNANGQFQGIVRLGNSQFALSGTNTTALSGATLALGAGNTTVVGSGEQAIGGLTLEGAYLDFSDAVVQLPSGAQAGSWISTGALALLGGRVGIDFASSDLQSQPGISGAGNLLSQDDNVQVALIRSGTAPIGNVSNLSLVDRSSGQPISDAFSVNVIQGGSTVAVADYDFIFNTVDGSGAQGLFVGYGLRQLDLQNGQALALAPTSTASGQATDLAALLIGGGGLIIDAGGNRVSLSNAANDYRGDTQVRSGTLQFANDGVLGLTSLLDIAPGASVETGSFNQSIGKLIAQPGSRLVVDGVLTITDAQRAAGDPSGGSLDAGTLYGTGSLVLDPSLFEVNGANAGYTGDVTVSEGSHVILNNAQGVGSAGTLTLAGDDDLLTFGQVAAAPGVAPSGVFSKSLAGQGTVQLIDAAAISLGADNSAFSGLFDIAPGTTLNAGQASHLGSAAVTNEGTFGLSAASNWSLTNAVAGAGTVVKTGAATLTVTQALSGFTGTTQINAGTLELASAGVIGGNATIAPGARLLALNAAAIQGPVGNAGEFQVQGAVRTGGFVNSGTLRLVGSTIGNTLTVNGDYEGQGGTVFLNTVLAGDDAPTDRLIVLGNTRGSSWLQVNGVAGNQQGTTQGIRVVQVDGQSDGVFTLQGRVVGGPFEYGLFQGSISAPADGDWYLRAQAVRPEVGAYLGNQYAAATLLRQTLRERTGEPSYVQVTEDNTTAAWARYQGQQIQSGFRLDGLQQDLRVQTDMLQVGMEFLRRLGSHGRWHAGLMAAHGETTTDADSLVLERSARGRVTANALGGYATWFQDPTAVTGAYVDAWLQYASFDNKVRGDGLPQEKYDADSWTTSVEAGYTFAVHESGSGALYLEPQLQALYTDFSVDSHRETNGTEVQGRNGGLTTRLGLRVHGGSRDDRWGRVHPFAEINWWYTAKDNLVVFDGRRVQQDLPSDVYEARVGFDVSFNPRWSSSLSLGLQDGSDDYRNVVGTAGLRAAW